ncbi:MAG: DUF2180 family protein [Planctomycetaceae bacterium]|nr:DUF2180 family protein [Planctomycetaceae bacterium]
MKCSHCEADARAICVFCGRAVCTEHRKARVNHTGFGKKSRDSIIQWPTDTAHQVEDATWCGICDPKPLSTF